MNNNDNDNDNEFNLLLSLRMWVSMCKVLLCCFACLVARSSEGRQSLWLVRFNHTADSTKPKSNKNATATQSKKGTTVAVYTTTVPDT
jgi:hypothetical protein